MTKPKVKSFYPLCDVPRSDGRKCTKTAGWGTDHVGFGPCDFHDGATPGPDSHSLEGTVQSKLGEYQHDPNILDYTYDIAVMRLTRDKLLEKYLADPRDLPMARALVDCTDKLIKARDRLAQLLISKQLIMTVDQANKLVQDIARIVKTVFDKARKQEPSPIIEGVYREILEEFKQLEMPQATKVGE